jgi:gluconolactonase
MTTYLKPSGYTGSVERGGEMGSNGLAIDAAGHLLLCQHGDRRVASMNAPLSGPKAEYNTLAGEYQGKRFNSPNDLAIHSSGAIYFTDPAYGMPRRFDDPNRELPYVGVFRVSADGVVTLLTDKLKAPNGIAFSPDEKTLYVAQSDRNEPVIMAYAVQADGTLDEGRVLFDASGLFDYGRGLPDGLKVDTKGNLFATGPGGVLVISPEGKHFGTIVTGQATSNCAFGDDGQTLYMTADMVLCRIRLSTTGNGF